MAHETRTHAVLSASASKRWLSCPPSAKLNAELPDTTSEYAREGTCAHELAEYKVNKLLGVEAKDPTENLDFYDSEMEDCTDSYAQYISEQMSQYATPVVMVEQRLDFSKYVPGGFGTGDCIIVADDVLTVIDFKYGKGVAVDAEGNPQMMLYALGALEMFCVLYDIGEIKMVIFQPRIENISESVITVSDLLDWAENELKLKAELAAKGKGEFCAGEHCRFCKVKATCRKRAEYNLAIAQYDFAPPDMLEDNEIEMILERADALVSWAADVKEYALSQALSGKQWNGYKVVEGKSNRRYTDEKLVAEAVKAAGKNPYSEPEVLGITAMTKLLGGKKKFDELLSKYVCKPQGKYNAEGYYSPTEYEAFTRVEKEERAAKRAADFRPIVYICSPYSGNVNHNIEMARKYSRFAVDRHYLPIAPHLLFTQFMDDTVPKERETAIFMNFVLMSKCAEMWVFGDTISAGMQAEINRAKRKYMKIRYFTEEMEEKE